MPDTQRAHAPPTEAKRERDAFLGGDASALAELYSRYTPLLSTLASQRGVPRDEISQVVTTLLDDVFLRLVETRQAPVSLTRYLVASLTNRARNVYRDDRHYHESLPYSLPFENGESVVVQCHSAFGMTAAFQEESPTISPALGRLAAMYAALLTDDETRLMLSVGSVPLPTLARELGISYGAVRVRLSRTRTRLRGMVSKYLSTLTVDERHEVERFLRRAGQAVQS